MKTWITIFIVCSFIFYGCSGECEGDGYDYVRLISTVESDSVVSEKAFLSNCFEKPFCYEAKVEEKSADSMNVVFISKKDTLSHFIARQKGRDVYVVVDTIPIPSCQSVHWLAERGNGHYRVDSKRLYSCVFSYEPSCE